MDQMKGLWRYHLTHVFVMATLLTMMLGLAGLPLLHSQPAA
jgi:hypothetical protein